MKLTDSLPRKFSRVLFAFGLSCAALLAAEPSKSPPPAAKITSPTKEADLATLTLTPEAEKRLGIVTVPVERRKLARTRLFGGEVILPAQAAGDTNVPRQSLFTILPSLSSAELVRVAQSQIDADGQVDQAKVQFDAAKVALARAEQLLRDKAGIARAVDEARVQVSLAESGLRTAQARRELLGPPVLDAVNPSRLWVRVPVYVGDLARVNAAAEARVGSLSGNVDTNTRPAKPVSAPPSANAAAATVDLFYEIQNPDGALRLGQRVGVTVPLRDDEESLVVPFSAVVHDVQGGAWVYEKSAPQAYTRRRVQMLRVVGESAALTSGVKPGANIVITGVAELFGTEFGAVK
jgi:hypothetical protein